MLSCDYSFAENTNFIIAVIAKKASINGNLQEINGFAIVFRCSNRLQLKEKML